jgi:uncharacterized protein (DUF2252 family)
VTASESRELGKARRSEVPRSAHADWAPGPGRRDPVDVLTDQDATRLSWLVPVRHGRMLQSPFAFFRGAAAIMAADLSTTPSSGITVQLCGDAHVSNFGLYASPERRQVFDVNDFDETLPGPWEWDVKRLAASAVVAAREGDMKAADARAAADAAVGGYRDAMRRFSTLPILDVWYAQASVDALRSIASSKSARKALDAEARKARKRTSERALGRLTERVDGELQVRSDPPVLVPLRELAAHLDRDQVMATVREGFASYVDSLDVDRRHLLERFTVMDLALKVVGVGSVGTRCFLALLRGRAHHEPLILQVKEAGPSVLEGSLPRSRYVLHGKRVVVGQRLLQASTDIFLGWSKRADGRHFYWRQYHDMKGSVDVLDMGPGRLADYARVCGWALAHAHARTGDACEIAGYLGRGASFDDAVAEFAVAYADQNAADFEACAQAARDGRLAVEDD